jgi:RNA polymerase sigma-70 factor (ECF subfamily)
MEEAVAVTPRRLFGLGGPSEGPAEPPAAASSAHDQEAELLARIARGDGGAFEVLFDRYSAAVYGMVLQVLRDPAQSEEVAQDVLVEVWRTASRFDPDRGSVRAWLLTMARRRAIDRVRSAQAAGDREARLAAAATPDFDEVSEVVELRLEREQVRRCLEVLTGLQRESIHLAFYRGYTHREVSDVLGVPLGTVKTRLRDGLIRLRDCLGVSS